MPSLLVPSPTLVDQSFPRDESELRSVAVALGELELLIQQDEAHVVLTDVLAEVAESFDWEPPRPFGLLVDIHRLVSQWFLSQHEALVRVNLGGVSGHTQHPVPNGCSGQGLLDIWADELGRLLFCHDQSFDGYCIGVACHLAFGGDEVGSYVDHELKRFFPLVGPDQIESLDDAYEYEIPEDILRREVSFTDAYNNVGLLGATSILKPKGGSHYKVRFPNARPWPLDYNVDPVPDRFVKELIDITGLPLEVIKTVLIEGRMPRRILRIKMLQPQ